MDIEQSLKYFNENGFVIVPGQNIDMLNDVRSFIANQISSELGVIGTPEEVINNCHLGEKLLCDSSANALVLKLISKFSEKYDMADIVYQSSKRFIDNLIGPDIVCQRNPNIVLQYPGSSRYSELHTDTPGNSPFEVVAWLPLVSCYKTKSFYILSPEKTKHYLELYDQGKFTSWHSFKKECINNSTHLTVDYGSTLFFWSGLLHGSLVNEELETRLCLNVRYKSTYAPHGKKDPVSFFRVLKSSGVTSLVSKYA